MPARKYSLIEAFPPVIKEKLVEKDIDPGVGGIKLIYQESSVNISLNPEKDKRKRIFLKPLKEFIADNKKDCEETFGKGSWGNTSSILSNVWIEITSPDYKDIKKSYKLIRYVIVAEANVIKYLNRQTEEFIIGQIEPITKLKLSERARLFWDQIRNW
jgi:hypothetical protein